MICVTQLAFNRLRNENKNQKSKQLLASKNIIFITKIFISILQNQKRIGFFKIFAWALNKKALQKKNEDKNYTLNPKPSVTFSQKINKNILTNQVLLLSLYS